MERYRSRQARRFGAAAAAGIVGAAALLGIGTPQQAGAIGDQPLSGTASSMWQTNDTVSALAVAGGRVYAGGRFTAVRPPGAAAGTSETARTYLAAFTASNGTLVTGFNVTLNGRVRALAVSPNGTRLYIGGDFTTVNGVTRRRVASIVLPGGALDTTFNANPSASVVSLEATAANVYIGGDFSTVNGVARSRIAALDPATGALRAAFTATADGRVYAIEASTAANRVLIGGAFDNVNGVLQGGIASLDPTTGALMPWAATGISPRPAQGGCSSVVKDILISGTTAYVTSEGTEPGCWEGAYQANLSDGTLIWNQQCLGGSQGIELIAGWIYRASHMHDCGRNPGGFVGPRRGADFVWYRLVAHNASTGEFGHWTPNTNGAGVEHVGPHVLATDGTQIFVGGDFTTVNNAAQQGITRFAPVGTNSTPDVPAAPSVAATGAGTLTVNVLTSSDREDGTLTYSLLRDGGTTPIATWVVESYPWTLPVRRFDDSGLAPGVAHTYRVRVSDGTATATSVASPAVVVPGTNPGSHADAVLAATPAVFWDLDDAGPAMTDGSGNGIGGTATGGVATGQPGAVDDGASIDVDGATGSVVADTPITPQANWSASAWFRSTSLTGGTIVGLQEEATGAGDRAIWMDNNGQVAAGFRAIGTRGPTVHVVRSLGALNDGQWHHVAATFDGTTAAIYVDGKLDRTNALIAPTVAIVPAASRARVGHTNLATIYSVFGRNFSGNPAPISYVFDGGLDDAAYYDAVLDPAQIAAMYAAGIASQLASPPPPPPSYASVISTDAPWMYWRLGEAAGPTAVDATGNARNGTYRNGVTFGVTGALASGGDTAVTNGTSGVAYLAASITAPTVYSTEAWFRTTSTSGGKIVGFENVQTGWGSAHDRVVYMTNNGRLAFGIVSGGVRQTITTAASYNNGAWHHVVATHGPSGITLYIDGASVGTLATGAADVYTGFWRVGGGNLTGWPNPPASASLAGSFDEIAVYPTVLSPAQVAVHYAARLF
jgi:hypothetical protein